MTATRIPKMLAAAAKELLEDNGLRLAASLSYYTLFSLVPLLFLAAAVAGYVFGDPDAVSRTVDQATEVAGTEVGKALEDLLEGVQDQRAGALSIGILLSAFAAASIFQQVQAVLGLIFHIPVDKRREGAVGWLIRRLIGIASAVGLATLVTVPIAAVGGINWLIGLLPDSVGSIATALRFAIPALSVMLLMLATGLTFQALTAIEIPWRAALVGGATTALMGLTAAFLVGTYLNTAGTTGTLGALGGVAILLFFFNLLWITYLYGAEVTKVYADYLQYGDIQPPSERGSPDRARSGADSSAVVEADSRTAPFVAGVVVGWLVGRGGSRR